MTVISAVRREATVHQMVCDFIRLRYPDVVFRTDYAAGLKLTMGQAISQKRLQSSRSYPDLFLAEPRGNYHGLYLELKRGGTRVFLKDGSLSTDPHIQEQAAMLNRLRGLGYRAEWGVGWEQATDLINEYMELKKTP